MYNLDKNTRAENPMKLRAIAGSLIFLYTSLSFASGVKVGTWDSGNCMPFQCQPAGPSSQSSRYAQIYDASLFSEDLVINSIEFFKTSADANLMSFDYEIRLSTTSSSSSSYSLVFSENTGADSMLFAQGSFSPNSGEYLSFYGDSFHYDQSEGNLLVDILITNSSGSDSAFPRSLQMSFAPGLRRIYGSAAYGEIPETGSTGWTGEAPPQGLVTGFNISPQVVPIPAAVYLFGSGLGLLGWFRRRQS
jgi:hypothetical protein